MPIKIKRKDGKSCPIVICDWCGEEIEDAKKGNYEWRQMKYENEKDGAQIFFTHKQCCRQFEEHNGGRLCFFAEELEIFPLYLKNNLRIDWEELKKKLWTYCID